MSKGDASTCTCHAVLTMMFPELKGGGITLEDYSNQQGHGSAGREILWTDSHYPRLQGPNAHSSHTFCLSPAATHTAVLLRFGSATANSGRRCKARAPAEVS